MARFVINEGYAGEITVEAKDFVLSNDIFWFADEEEETVLVYAREKVVSIRREG